jgi:hypothetical protein
MFAFLLAVWALLGGFHVMLYMAGFVAVIAVPVLISMAITQLMVRQ